MNAWTYAITALALVALKYGIDHTIALRYDVPWPWTVYVLPARDFNIFGVGSQHPAMFWQLWAVAVPFLWMGVALTLRRLRDAGLGDAWLVLFFVPAANFLLFLLLSFAPTRPKPEREIGAGPPLRPNAPLLGFVLAVLVGVVLVVFSAQYLAQYAWGLFLGVPFLIGFLASWSWNSQQLHTPSQSCGVGIAAVLLVGVCLLGFRVEGLVCLAMAFSLAAPIAAAGALVARMLMRQRVEGPLTGAPGLSMCIALLPVLMVVEHRAAPEPPVRPVVTSVVIAAPAKIVWAKLIAFSPIAAPREWIFRTGVAYPVGATITGTGAGAVRRCRFSTGDFVEPITTWDEDHLLAFTVAEQPPALTEITLGGGVLRTPHLERNYFRSRHGQLRLVALDANHTLLEGTTWYQDYFWPQVYWRGWSDAIVHRIHMRVLEHVKEDAEAATLRVATER